MLNKLLLVFLVGLSASLAQAQPPTPLKAELVSVDKIWDRGQHNAFTDLIRFQNLFYCTFREAAAHVGGNGQIRVLASYDAKTWSPVALISEEGIDLRDPKFCPTKEDRLFMVAGGSTYQGTQLMGRRPRVMTSTDGKNWSPPVKVLADGDWLWRATLHDGRYYGTVYNTHPTTGGPKEEAEWSLKLYTSVDSKAWSLNAPWEIKGRPNEATVRVLKDGTMMALVRREAPGMNKGMIGTAPAPFRTWTWNEITVPLGGPNFIELPDGRLIAGSRGFGKTPGAHMVLFQMTANSLTPVLELPSSGDCSYPGLVFHEGHLYVSYYSSHEGKTSIYLAKVKID
jgi:hypothetical protein